MTQPGRKPGLTPEIHGKIVEYTKAGNYLDTAARMAGCDPRRVREWIQWGREGQTKHTGTKWLEVYQRFADDMDRAQAEAEARCVMLWQKAMPEDWRAIEAFLKRRFPERWGDKQRIDVPDESEDVTPDQMEKELDQVNRAFKRAKQAGRLATKQSEQGKAEAKSKRKSSGNGKASARKTNGKSKATNGKAKAE